METIEKQKSFENPKKFAIIVAIIVATSLLILGGTFLLYYSEIHPKIAKAPVITKPALKKIDEETLSWVKRCQFYGQPLDFQNIDRSNPFVPY
jgi:hypothetical protein